MEPYFYNECLRPGKGKNSRALVFKSDRFGLFVVVPEKQWEEYETFKEKRQQGTQVSSTSSLLVAPPQARQLRTNHCVAPSTITSSTSDLSSFIAAPISRQLASATVPNPPKPSASQSDATAPLRPTSMSTKRRHRQRSHSGSNTSSRSPPLKRTTKSNFASPDRNQLKEALRAGGAVDFDIKDGKIPSQTTAIIADPQCSVETQGGACRLPSNPNPTFRSTRRREGSF